MEVVSVFFFVLIGLIVGLSLLFNHLRWRRETVHQERLKYLERGMMPPDTDRGPSDRERVLHNSFWIAFWTGGVVPVVTVVAGAITSAEMRFNSGGGARSEALFFLWGGIVAIAVAGVASAAAIMVSTSRRADDRGQSPPGDARGYPPAG